MDARGRGTIRVGPGWTSLNVLSESIRPPRESAFASQAPFVIHHQIPIQQLDCLQARITFGAIQRPSPFNDLGVVDVDPSPQPLEVPSPSSRSRSGPFLKSRRLPPASHQSAF